ncbi:glycosyltransferase family 39 protein [Mesorhizobium sp. SP-1A]|uniref:glycosyltransferase family 39 protein n=1 Tax=Mesorhizobium sp. SP-1A TaxID=3077840 RepID=UPI0028F71EA1|nr:glycosyltransferase family 39 protein [Mesorhizobium sp. SP-1A]
MTTTQLAAPRTAAGSLNGVVALVCLNALLCFAVFSLTRRYLDYSDMVENYAWGISWALGNNKHPPLFGWIAAAWFGIFPKTDGAYYLLAAVNLLVSFLFLALSMRRFLSPPQLFVAVALTLMFSRFGVDAGYKYNANVAQYPFIAAFLWAVLNGVETRRDRWWVLSGVFVAAAVLCKYSAAALVVAMAVAAWMVLRPDLRIVLRGAGIAAAVSIVLVAPHVWWEIRHGWPSLGYMEASHGAAAGPSTAAALLDALSGAAQYSALPLAVWMAINLWPGDGWRWSPRERPRQRLGLAVYAVSFLMTCLSSWAGGVDTVAAWFIVPSLFVGWAIVDGLPNTRPWPLLRRRMVWAYAFYAVAFAAIYAGLALYPGRGTPSQGVALQRQLALDADAAFKARYGGSAGFAAGDFPLPYAFSFYAPGRTQSLFSNDVAQSPWIDPSAFRQGSKVVLCGTVDGPGTQVRDDCVASATRLLGEPASGQEFTYTVPGTEDVAANRRVFSVLFYPAARTD